MGLSHPLAVESRTPEQQSDVRTTPRIKEPNVSYPETNNTVMDESLWDADQYLGPLGQIDDFYGMLGSWDLSVLFEPEE